MPLTPTSKIQVVLHPALPAVCVVCRRSANGDVRFIDFNFNLDYYGAVVFCEDCIKEAFDVFDYVPRAELEARTEALNQAHDLIEELQENNGRLNATLDNVLVLRPGLRDSDSSATAADDSDSEERDSGTKDD